MSDLDMELQTIRQKLQTLKASPPETVAAPWGQSRLAAPSPDLAQVTTAIETLRQRSNQSQHLNTSSSNLQQFDAMLSTVENLAQQQQQALQQLQTLGESLTQKVQSDTSADIDDISRFLEECQSIQIPTVYRDRDGYLEVGYHTFNFRQTAQDATPRPKTKIKSQLFQHSVETPPRYANHLSENPYPDTNTGRWFDELTHVYQLAYRSIYRWIRRYVSVHSSRSSNFTLVDASIWCIGAVITRILLNQILQLYPTFWTPVALFLISGIIISLYQAIFSIRPNPVLGYRTLMVVLGLLIGGRFT